MKISISGRHMEIGEAFKHYVEERLNKGIQALLQDVNLVEVVVSKETHHIYNTHIIVHEGHGLGLIRGEENSDEVHNSFDLALIKIEKQLRKYKERIKSKKRKASEKLESLEIDSLAATKYIIEPIKNENAHDETHVPVTIAEKPTNIEHLSVSEAIMKMDLAHVPALLFINKSNKRLNIVYYREDGNIAWIDHEGLA